MDSLLYYDFTQFTYFVRGDGKLSKRYKHWCILCKKDRGFAFKNKIMKEPMCHACKMKQPDVLKKISINSKKLVHSEKSKAKTSASLYKRYGSTPYNRLLSRNLRARLNKAIKFKWKSGSAVADLGCSIDQLKQHLEAKFQPGMSWENYGRRGWHIDHIKPLCSFDLQNKVQLEKACHYTNLQPLWWNDNLKKRLIDGTIR